MLCEIMPRSTVKSFRSPRSKTRHRRHAFSERTAAGACRYALAAALLICAAFQPTDAVAEPGASSQSPDVVATAPAGSALRYDAEYPVIAYADKPSHNAIARLQARLERGELRLKFQPPRGYLDSVLSALGIDPSSQTLVYSKTSLQLDLIRAATPRAIYFDDNTYVAWIPGTAFLEIATMDSAMGPVFYTLSNQSPSEVRIDRQTSRCLTCHDTWGMAGGGVPRFLFLSTLVDTNGEALNGKPGDETTDQTPIRDRWAGWYVTGRNGNQGHLGNILAEPGEDISLLDSLRRVNIDTLEGLFDSRPYLTDKSDIVALLIFEHQTYIEGFITRANFKSRMVLARNGEDASGASAWVSLPPNVQKPLKAMLEPLVRAMLFVDAATVTSRISSSSGYDTWFQSQGPRDPKGRSLRELDLRTRIFKRPLSYLVYSESFDGLPPCAKEYVYTRLADILSGRDQSPTFSHLSTDERRDLLEILTATKPPFASVARERSAVCEHGSCSG